MIYESIVLRLLSYFKYIILKQHKKSIDFLSIDGSIYPWTTNGNYSPSKLYRNGMIEGSPFNVDSIDFIGIFGLSEEDE